MKPTLQRAFVGADGKILLIWRAVLFYALGTFLVFPVLGRPMELIARSLDLGPGLSAGNIALGELGNLVVALFCTGVFALYEHRRVDSYGLPVNRA